MKRIVQPFTIEALDYPYDLARQVLDLFPDEWAAVTAYPLIGHPGFYKPGEDLWRLYESTDKGSRYAEFMVPVQDMLDPDFRAKKLDEVRATLAEMVKPWSLSA